MSESVPNISKLKPIDIARYSDQFQLPESGAFFVESTLNMLAIDAQNKESAINIFNEFTRLHSPWAHEIVMGLSTSMRLLDSINGHAFDVLSEDVPATKEVFIADLLSDCGKLRVPKHVLAASITGEGWDDAMYIEMKQHTTHTRDVLYEHKFSETIVKGASSHHLFQEVSYGPYTSDELTKRQEMIARILGVTDFTFAAVARGDRAPLVKDSLYKRIHQQVQRSFGELTDVTSLQAIASEVYESATVLDEQLGA